MKRMLVFSDVHFFRDKDIKEKEGPLTLKEKIALKLIRVIWPDREDICQEYFYRMVDRVRELEPISYILDIGDATFFEKSGEKRDIYVRARFDAFPWIPTWSVQGNHDLNSKYLFSRFWNRDDGFNREVFLWSKRIFGPSWSNFEIRNFTFLLLNSEVIQAAYKKNSKDREFFVGEEKKQEEYIRNVLEEAPGKVIIAIHNPRALRHIRHLLEPYYEKIDMTLAGHVHSPFLGKFSWRWLLPFRKINLKIIPPPWYWKGSISREEPKRGGGFVILEISGNTCRFSPYWL